MPLFAVECLDKPSSAGLRDATRPAHLAYMRGLGTAVRMAGPLMNESGASIGSLLFIESEDVEGARAILALDPYVTAGLFQSIAVRPLQIETGSLAALAG